MKLFKSFCNNAGIAGLALLFVISQWRPPAFGPDRNGMLLWVCVATAVCGMIYALPFVIAWTKALRRRHSRE